MDEDGVATALTLIRSLDGSSWCPRSPRNPSYNCFAWAAREANFWVEPPGTAPWACWPDDLPEWDTLENYIRAYAKLGFTECDTADLEPGVEKIAIFTDGHDAPTHAARQLPSGRWTSKFGKGIDFEHDLDEIDGDPAVGSIARCMERPSPGEPPPPPSGLILTASLDDDLECVFDQPH